MALYPYHIQYKPASNLAVITTSGQEPLLGELTARANIRHRPDAQTAIVLKAAKGETLALYERENNFTRVRTTDGLLGFVLTEDITETEFMVFDPVDYLLSRPIVNTAPLQPMWPANKKINLMWEYMNNPDAVVLKMERPIPDGVDIISPKFFWLGEETLLESVASREYVNWAHEQGVQVWAMVQDIRSGLVHKAIADPASRRRLVRLLADYAREYNLDGINIDFEHISAREGDYYGPYFIQFLRELAVALRPQGVVLSVDVYVPSLWSAFYRRDLIALTADFLCVMTYDEHWAGGPSSGPVASLPFVYKGVSDMLEKEQVPKEQLLMGLPYYNRIWREVVNNDSPETRKVQHFTMERTKQLFTDRDIIPEWDAFIGSFYGEFAAVEDGETVLYRVWIEDEYSIAEKLKIFEAHDLAGVAGWQRGFENEAVQILLKRATDSQ
jgi:spore germination protein YaaH